MFGQEAAGIKKATVCHIGKIRTMKTMTPNTSSCWIAQTRMASSQKHASNLTAVRISLQKQRQHTSSMKRS